jgi:hypothetical protein
MPDSLSPISEQSQWAYTMWEDARLKADGAKRLLEEYRISLALVWRLRRNTYRALGFWNNDPMKIALRKYRRQRDRARALAAMVPELERAFRRVKELHR